MVGLLEMGNKLSPKKELIGEAGTKALAEVKERAVVQGGLAAFFEGKEGGLVVKEVLGESGLPPLPNGAGGFNGVKRYEMTEENAYPAE